ncbi:MAG: phosphoribosylanthranilate isomerase [Candidatus Odinarchaeia archaeon]
MQVKVKICGITRKTDLKNAVNAGADMVGFIVNTPESPRNISVKKARELMKLVPRNVETVIVSTTSNTEEIREIALNLKPSAIQVYTQLGSSLCGSLKNIKKMLCLPGLKSTVELAYEVSKNYDAIVVDTFTGRKLGGTGVTHNWKITREIRDKLYPTPIFIAGGLTPENVEAAVLAVKPYGVDVSSGVESSPGVKDPEKIITFIHNAKKVKY